ncbi:MAG: PKD domain-containing protein, partial [Thermoplasmata archaeon]
VKGKNSDGRYVISSDIYSFTYRPAFAPVATLCAPLPGSIVGVSNIELIYDATDPDTPKDEINFKLYLDETNATTLIYEGKDRKHLVNLENGKKYYWRVEASDGKKKHITEAWNFTTDANMQLQALPEITLIKPRDCEKINESNVTFSWSTSSGKNSNLKYKLYLDSTEGNSIYAETNRTNLNVSLSYGMYFWKVEVENGAIGRISEIRHFFVTVYNESTPPTIPMLIEPIDGDVFAKNEVNFVVISQDPNGRGISYIFQFASNPTFNNARSETSNSGEITISFDAGTYYWRVKASNGVTDSAWSRTQTFTIDTSQSGLGVVLISPENGSKVKTLTTRLVWSINTRANALYKVYLSEDQAAVLNCRESACIRENTYQSNITSGFLKNGKRYYWTVVPVANRAWGICRSGVFYFDTEIPSSQFDVKASARSVSVGDEVTIKAEISQDLLPEGNIEYYFDFGDGTNSGWISNNSVTHKFGTSGKYNVKVKARSNAGGVWTETSEYKTEVSVSGGLCGTLIWYGAVFVLTLFVCTVSSKYAQKNRKERGKKFFKRIFTRRKEAKKRRKMRRR